MSKKSINKIILPSQTYIVKYKGTTQYLGLDANYIKFKQYFHYYEGVPASVFTIIFPPIYNTELLKVGEIVNLKSDDFIWNTNGYFLPTLSFKECNSYSIEEYYSDSTDENNVVLETINESNTNHITSEKKVTVDDIINDNQHSFYLSWENVLFRNGHILFASPYSKDGGKGKIISWSDCTPDFEHIKPALQKKFPIIKVKINNLDIVDVVNIDEITSAIISLKKRSKHLSDIRIKNTQLTVISKPKRMDVSEIQSLPEIKSSAYLKELCKNHIKDFPIFYCTETKNTFSGNASPEKAFVFCLKDTGSYLIIIYENTIISRSSYVFKIKRGGFISTINRIHDFFSSSLENKREKLSTNSIEFPPKVISYTRIIHNSFEQWISDIQKSCNYIL